MISEAEYSEMLARTLAEKAKERVTPEQGKALLRASLPKITPGKPPCHGRPKQERCDREGPGGFMGHACEPKQALPPAIGKLSDPGFKNKGEAEYDAYLDIQQKLGLILWHKYEAVTLKLGQDCRLTLDQLVMYPDGHLELLDTKGAKKIKTGKKAGKSTFYAEEDAVIKARIAAGMFPIPVYFVFKDKGTGEWIKQRIGASE